MTASLKNSIKGEHIHVNPLVALENLTLEMAAKVPENSEHSCWHILHHIVFWQDLMLEALRGKTDVDWPKSNDLSWPKELSKDGTNWDELVQRFKSGIDEAYGMAENIESLEALPSWPKVPAFRALMVFGQHNAYHLGEIVATRQALGLWPPSSDHKTF
ncbi:MAG: DinB family protein [Candidatus Thorarchaeota archaeon]|nr:DinB family protein [Candidatus Thorarchaeota archaeon]